MRTHSRFVWVTLLALPLAAAAAEAAPAFGPQTFENTSGSVETYSVRFQATAGDLALYLRNGDDESTRVDSAAVTLNGNVVVGPTAFDDPRHGLRRPVALIDGENVLDVEIAGPAGSFVAIAIGSREVPPLFTHGRLVLPWARNDADATLAVALKNGSPRAPRAVRLVFFHPTGEVAAASPRFVLPPRASLSRVVADWISAGAWQAGSIEVFYAGPGTAPLFGHARQWLPVPAAVEIVPLQQAGRDVFRGRTGPESVPRTGLRR